MPIENSKGLTLIEIVIAVGLFSIVAVGASSFLLSSVKMKVDLQEKQGFIELANRIASASRSTQLCNEFELAFPAGSSLNLSQASGNVGQKVNLKVDNETIDGTADQPRYGLVDSELRISNLKALGAMNAAGDPMYQGILRLRAQKANSELGGKEIRNRLIGSAIVGVGGGQITSCHGDIQVPSAGCVVDSTTGMCLGSGLPTQSCAPGSIISGYLNGTVQCRALISSCPAGQVVTGIVNGVLQCASLPPPHVAAPIPAAPNLGDIELELRYLTQDSKCSHLSPCMDFNSPSVISSRLGMPECGVPVLYEKCFMRSFEIAVAEQSGSITPVVNILIGVPKW